MWRSVLEAVESALQLAGAVIMGWMVSPLRGAKGNVEFFVHVRTAGGAGAAAVAADPRTIDDAIEEAVRHEHRDRSSCTTSVSNAAELARQAAQWLHERGHEVRRCRAPTPRPSTLRRPRGSRREARPGRRARRQPRRRRHDAADRRPRRGEEVPVLGVNVGLLGYLTEVEPNAMTARPRALLRRRTTASRTA